MLHHFSAHCDTGPCVAYIRPGDGSAVVALECPTAALAQAQAIEMNLQSMRDTQSLRRWMTADRPMRRGVRFFDDELAD